MQANLRRFYELGAADNRREQKILRLGDLCLDTEGMILTKNGRTVSLTPTEYRILKKLMGRRDGFIQRRSLRERRGGIFGER